MDTNLPYLSASGFNTSSNSSEPGFKQLISCSLGAEASLDSRISILHAAKVMDECHELYVVTNMA